MVTKSGGRSEEQEFEAQMEKASMMVQETIGRMLKEGDLHPHIVVLGVAKVMGELMGALAAASSTDLDEVVRDTFNVAEQAAKNYYDAIGTMMPVAGSA